MQSPYTHNPHDAFMVVEGATGAALTALLWWKPLQSLVATALFLSAIWIACTVPDAIDVLRGLGLTESPTQLHTALHWSALLATLAFFVARPFWPGIVALAGQLGLDQLAKMETQSDSELAGLHVAWLGLLFGLHLLVEPREWAAPARRRPPSHADDDAAIFLTATVAAALVGWFVLQHRVDSADEWAYTFQAATFAKLHAWSNAPPCYPALQSFWVFSSEGRLFSQYTPGWPLFMAPFFALRVWWLAAPCSLGLLAVGSARLARRVARDAWDGEGVAARAGLVAAFGTILSSTLLINGGSRFSHVFVAALFAWMVEGVCAMGERDRPREHDARWGAIVGVSAAWLLATRPSDGALLGCSAALYFLYLLVTARLSVRGVVAAAVGFVLIGGLTLVVLRLQLGKWFTTGYSLTESIHPWAKFALSKPRVDDLRWAVPLQTGSYCWWPLTPALGLTGLAAGMRGRSGRPVAFMLVVAIATLCAFYSMVEYGRGVDFGYGPRYELPAVVAMAVGAGVVLGPMWAAASRRVHAQSALLDAGPFAIAAFVALSCVVRLVPALYPNTYDDVRARNIVFAAASHDHLRNALVWIVPHTTVSDPLDLTQNLPLDLYPGPEVLYAIDRGPEMRKCMSAAFPTRRQFHTEGRDPVRLVPE